jgi:hypothetical protein
MRSMLFLALLAACSNAADPQDTPDASVDAAADAPAGPPLDILRVNEVVASGAPDWFEIVNVTSAAVELSEYCYLDSGPLAMCRPFAAMSLGPGERFVQDVDDAISGFKLGSDEEVAIYRSADQRLSDKADWAEGDAPANESWARIPDTTGTFARTNVVTRNAANVANNPNAPLMILVVNEVAASETPDWVELANATAAPVQLSEYCIVDSSAAACSPLPSMALAAGGYVVVDVSDALTGFGLGNDDAVLVKRIADLRLSDSADYPAGGASPAGSSYARSPTITGPFATTATQTKGAANN